MKPTHDMATGEAALLALVDSMSADSATWNEADTKKLIETTERVTFDEGLQGLVGDMPMAFRATTIGSYHCNRWASTFAYMDAMLVDTPILEQGVRQEISRTVDSFDISKRLYRTVLFDEYLMRCWSEFAEYPVYFDWPTVRTSGDKTFQAVKRAVEKQGINGR